MKALDDGESVFEMRCEEAETGLMELIEEELPPAQRVKILSHLQACATCAVEFSSYRDLLAQLRAEPVPEPSPSFWDEFLPSLKRRMAEEASHDRGSFASRLVPWMAEVRSWLGLRKPFIAGLAVAAASILILIKLPGFLPVGASRSGTPSLVGQRMGAVGERKEPALVSLADDGRRHSGEPLVVAGELVEDASVLAAAIQRLPWVGEIADRLETAWVLRPESDPREWLAVLSEEERQIVLDRMRDFRWSTS